MKGTEHIYRHLSWQADKRIQHSMNRFNTFTSSIDISSHEAWFTSYASSERAREHGDASPMDLKRQHTMAVLANANRIVLDERFEPQISRACLLAALYHDVGRFEQYLQYHTFRDKESCNHGQMGVRILKKKNRLADEAPLIRKLVLTAVGMHNRFVLPAHISHTAALVTNVVRDADKLDILRIMEEHLNGPGPYNPTVVLQQPDDPTIAGEGILNAVRECRVASYADLRCVNDFRLLLGTWFYDLHFNTARKMFLEDGHALALLRGLPDNTPQAPLRDFLLQQLTTAGA